MQLCRMNNDHSAHEVFEAVNGGGLGSLLPLPMRSRKLQTHSWLPIRPTKLSVTNCKDLRNFLETLFWNYACLHLLYSRLNFGKMTKFETIVLFHTVAGPSPPAPWQGTNRTKYETIQLNLNYEFLRTILENFLEWNCEWSFGPYAAGVFLWSFAPAAEVNENFRQASLET